MPGIYVFPGGRVGAPDRRPSGFAEPLAEPPLGLDLATKRGLRTFVRAALRETHEETGLLVGAPDRMARAETLDGPWSSYADAGVAPGFRDLRLIARAITPPASPIRFHNRFFLADGRLAHGTIRSNGELEDVGWYEVSTALKLPMAGIGTHVLSEALAHWQDRRRGVSALFRWMGAQMRPRFSQGPGR